MTESDKKGAKTAKQPAKKAPVYEKAQILAMGAFARDIDLISALLDDDKQYTADDALKIINTFKSKEVL